MRIVVLLSAGRHPATGAPCPVPAELQAIALARQIAGAGGAVEGLHAGGRDEAVLDALGHGIDGLTLVAAGAADDPLGALVAALEGRMPDLILAGRRGRGGADGGLLPYRLARALGWPIVADAIGAGIAGGEMTVTQALPRGGRRAATVRGAAVITVHPAAPAALPYVHRARLAGRVSEVAGPAALPAALPEGAEIRPYRARPKLIGDVGGGGSAEARLQAVSETRDAGGRVMLRPAPDEAAAAILEFVARFRPRKA
ncbi:MAG: electron transfer flavoprotein subunit beta [Rhodospirillales bacterium]|uniref:electron transfer flavoprotein subunit beta n=1 Tax=Acidiphilium sp. TaxID=527 RepID=UPI0025870D02|nr:electron transfer flavoprotein subunit beta [Acidiphilium sp.]MBU6357073.1 electron transfer flavoprotein subunit beta [Rhodospirillales bacterium]